MRLFSFLLGFPLLFRPVHGQNRFLSSGREGDESNFWAPPIQVHERSSPMSICTVRVLRGDATTSLPVTSLPVPNETFLPDPTVTPSAPSGSVQPAS